MKHQQQNLRLEWVRQDRGDRRGSRNPRLSSNSLLLRAECLEDGEWRPLGTKELELTIFPEAAPEAMQAAALEMFATALLATETREEQEALLPHLLWSELTDRDLIAAALQRVTPDGYVDFLFELAGVNPRAARRAIMMGSDEQLATIRAEDALRLIRHPNVSARELLLLSLRENSRRLPGVHR